MAFRGATLIAKRLCTIRETSPSHPKVMLRKRPLSWSIGYDEATSPSHPDGMLRKRPLFSLSKGRLQGANYLIINN